MPRSLITRYLHHDDIPALVQLAAQQKDASREADALVLSARLQAHPELCVGSFCERTGEALSAFFMQPVQRSALLHANSWVDCVAALAVDTSRVSRSLFGIGLACTGSAAMRGHAMDQFIWRSLLGKGWREVFWGSHMPGLRQALRRDPTLSVNAYARGKNRGLPRDEQLCYHWQRGLTDIVGVWPHYGSHHESMDYGALLRGDLSDMVACASSTLISTERMVERVGTQELA